MYTNTWTNKYRLYINNKCSQVLRARSGSGETGGSGGRSVRFQLPTGQFHLWASDRFCICICICILFDLWVSDLFVFLCSYQTKPTKQSQPSKTYLTTKWNLRNPTYHTKPTNQTYQIKPTKSNIKTKLTKSNLPNQTFQTKHTKSNLPNQTYQSKPT